MSLPTNLPTNVMKAALASAPMDVCPYHTGDDGREWWRLGWAVGFLGRSIVAYKHGVHVTRYNVALTQGFNAGSKNREEFELVGGR